MAEPLTETITFRLTSGEKTAVDALTKRRADQMAERGDAPDATLTGYLRSLIRREAKAVGIPVDAPTAPTPAPAKKAKTSKRGR